MMSGVAIDQAQFRRVLGHYPTGVCIVTALDPGGPVGMVVGSFASVSLDPPLVSFFPAKKSQTFRRIRSASSFIVNVLSSGQEELVRRLTSNASAEEKWRDVSWHSSSSGAPILDAALAWIECDFDEIFEGGDHYLVLGRVVNIHAAAAGLPLLFFKGGYGRFTSVSLVATPEVELTHHLRIAGVARAEMELIARETGLMCTALANVGADLVVVASVGEPYSGTSPPEVGSRIRFTPAFGTIFLAWAPDGASIIRIADETLDEDAVVQRNVARVRERGWSIALRPQPRIDHGRLLGFEHSLETEARALEVSQSAIENNEPEHVQDDEQYDLHLLRVPVWGPGDEVVLSLNLYGPPERVSGRQIRTWCEVLVMAARRISDDVSRWDEPHGETVGDTQGRNPA